MHTLRCVNKLGFHNFMCGRCSYLSHLSFQNGPFRHWEFQDVCNTSNILLQAELGIDRFFLVSIIDSRLWELFQKRPVPGSNINCVDNLSPATGARNQVGIGSSYRPASLCSLATQFQTRLLESIPRPIAGRKFSTLECVIETRGALWWQNIFS